MTREEFFAQGVTLSGEADVPADCHRYFVQHHARLYESCRRFGLLTEALGRVLEIGPFYGYTPFILQPKSSAYVVVEGGDPAAHPLEPLYRKREIAVRFVDLFETFGPVRNASAALDFDDSSFDTLLCWETMEHFNFNPVKLVREFFRVLRPGGRVCVTVPNRASLQNLATLLLGRMELHGIDLYFDTESYGVGGRPAFWGHHWREYTAPELGHLFSRAGFTLAECGTFVAFQDQGRLSLLRRVLRAGDVALARCLPRFGTNVCLVARK